MKKTAIVVLLSFLFQNQVSSQNPHYKNKILGITYHNHNTAVFGLLNFKNIKSFEEKEYHIKYMDDGFTLENDALYTLEKGKITSNKYQSLYTQGNLKYSYKNNLLEKMTYSDENRNELEVYSYKFDSKNRITNIKTTVKKNNTTFGVLFNYNDKNHTIQRYFIGISGNKEEVFTCKTNANGNIIEKIKKANTFTTYDEYWYFKYNANNLVTEASQKKVKNGKIMESSEGKSTYNYNNKGLIIEEKGNYSNSNFKLKNHYIYKYKYDRYGNWIAKYKFSTIYGFNDLKNKGYKNIKEVVLRKITYKNGITTGETHINASPIQNYLQQVVENNPTETRKPPKKGVYWKKIDDKGYFLYKDGKSISKKVTESYAISNHAYVFASKILYKLSDYTHAKTNKFIPAIPFANDGDMLWYLNDDNLYNHVVLGRSKTTGEEKLSLATNKKDIIYYINNVPKFVFLNATTTKKNQFQKALPYSEYKNQIDKTTAKNNGIPSGNVWKRNKKGGFWFYVNKQLITTVKTNLFINEHLLVYDSAAKKTYFFKNYKNSKNNTFFTAIPVSLNKFWYKTDNNNFMVIVNGKGEVFKTIFAPNKKDFILIKNNIKMYVIKGFQEAAAYQIKALIDYSSY